MGIIQEKLKHLPENSGVYVMLDENQNVIYVGKAKNLKNRVRQYFFNGVKTEKVMAMVKNVVDFYYIITPNEIDALSLENNLIKKHKPRYNVLLKDDKTYPYLRINLKDKFPTFTITRKLKKDGAKYFGPFMGGVSVREVLETVNLIYKLRPCDKLNLKNNKKPCLNHHLKRCLAPCCNLVSENEYKELVKSAIDFLNGDTEEVVKTLKEKMLKASEEQEFERAIKIRELLSSIEKLKTKRITSLNKFVDADVVGFSTNGIYSVVNLLIIRKGRMLGSRNFSMNCAGNESEAIGQFLTGYYGINKDIPSEILLGLEFEDGLLLQEYFNREFTKSVLISTPKQGVRKQLCDMANVNATEHLTVAVDQIKHKEDMTIRACEKLKEKLGLKNYPRRMECYDVSNVSGVDKVGSAVVFIDGKPEKDFYRRFKIESFEGVDDYRSHKEMMSRRLARLVSDPEKFPKPDLIVIDGGKGQLSAVKEVFDQYNITDIDLIALAEKQEEIYLLDRPSPVVLQRSDYCLKMLQRLRDEAHRFAITYHRTLRGKRALSSVLDGVSGLGKVKIRALLEKFKDLSGIISASKEELKAVSGIGDKQAELIIQTLTNQGLRKQ